MNDLLPLAEKMLFEHGEFYPYGGAMQRDGTIIHLGAKIDGTGHPPSPSLIALLLADFIDGAKSKKYKATALVYDVRIRPPGASVKTDAIQISLDHEDGFSVEVLFPYSRSVSGDISYGERFAQKGSDKVFRRPKN